MLLACSCWIHVPICGAFDTCTRRRRPVSRASAATAAVPGARRRTSRARHSRARGRAYGGRRGPARRAVNRRFRRRERFRGARRRRPSCRRRGSCCIARWRRRRCVATGGTPRRRVMIHRRRVCGGGQQHAAQRGAQAGQFQSRHVRSREDGDVEEEGAPQVVRGAPPAAELRLLRYGHAVRATLVVRIADRGQLRAAVAERGRGRQHGLRGGLLVGRAVGHR